MSDETAAGSSETPDGGRHCSGSGDFDSPLRTRAAFLENWDWQSIVSINQRACARGNAQHGFNSETGAARAAEWEQIRLRELSLIETFDFLRACHRGAPFLFFNGNTFSAVGRELALVLFAELPPARRRSVGSAVAHYIAGVLDREAMMAMVESQAQSAALRAGDRVKTLKGSLQGVVLEQLPDGRIKWRADTGSEFIALPESLLPDQ